MTEQDRIKETIEKMQRNQSFSERNEWSNDMFLKFGMGEK